MLFQAYPGKLHLCADGWTSPNVIAFIGTTIHWVVDGKIVSAILDFIKATKAHAGVYLAARIAECLREYKIQDKIMGFTADNASNNDTLVQELSVILPSFPGKKTRAILLPFSRKASQSSDSESDVDRELEMIEQEMTGGLGVGDEEPELDEEDDIAADVQMSDAAAVNGVTEDADLDSRLDPLSAHDMNIGRLSIAKRTSSFAMKYFDSLNETTATLDALEDWLASPIVNTNLDPVMYWTQMNHAGDPLARMAMDYLSIPASSTDVERSFSRGGLTISKLRHSLTDETARAACVMGSWTTLDGAIPKDRILESFKAKKQRLRKKARTGDSTIVIDD
ncbi:hypothetical protein D9613_012955 [Agrocybe pediades]|uniref:HAT C-terminal dimerisation domain-containing protein n=1 Tax=Agrocybe pediades TaxID=84607 RepID=A0A8H4VPB2_9AGAR|nr:hypothetical protein D9613_012955 [Agrocybe pediades]